jgi:hypothetical protein
VAAFTARVQKEMTGSGGYGYLDLYMGTVMMAGRADLQPVYEMIFRRLKARGHDWVYRFPRLGLVDLRPLKEHLDERAGEGKPDFAGYDPGATVAAKLAERKKR